MSNFVILWIVSVIVSYGISYSNFKEVTKRAAECGYRVNLKLMKKKIVLVFNEVKVLIPIINVMYAIEEIFHYEMRENLLDILRIHDILDRMTDKELEKYTKNPNKKTSYRICKEYDPRLESASSITLEDGSIIYYQLNDFNEYFVKLNIIDNVDIIRVEGKAKKLSNTEQKKLVINSCKNQIEKQFDKYLTCIKDFDKEFGEFDNLNAPNPDLIGRQIKELKDLKENFLSSQNQEEKEICKTKILK